MCVSGYFSYVLCVCVGMCARAGAHRDQRHPVSQPFVNLWEQNYSPTQQQNLFMTSGHLPSPCIWIVPRAHFPAGILQARRLRPRVLRGGTEQDI